LEQVVRGFLELFYEDYRRAAIEFSEAAAESYWPDGQQGREVVYLLAGVAQLRQHDESSAPQALIDAQRLFDLARAENGSYARNYLGLAAVLHAQALETSPEGGIVAVDPAKLVEAAGFYNLALDYAGQDPQAYVATKAHLGLGLVALQGARLGLPYWQLADAEAALQRVLDDFEAAGRPLVLAWNASLAHAALAEVARVQDDWQQMEEENRQAIETAELFPNPSALWIARYWSRIGLAREVRGDSGGACSAYELAVEIGRNPLPTAELNSWEEHIDILC
jgi:hypothetical protein